MPRVKRGSRRLKRRKKILRATKGYWGTKSKLHRAAKEQNLRSLAYAYRDRRRKKRDFRRLWIARINAAVRAEGMTYSQFMYGLRKANVEVDRKVLSDLAIHNEKSFKSLLETARSQIS